MQTAASRISLRSAWMKTAIMFDGIVIGTVTTDDRAWHAAEIFSALTRAERGQVLFQLFQEGLITVQTFNNACHEMGD